MNNNEPLISFAMPVYNAAAYLPEAIEGILNQSYTNLEIIICDNGSTDDSPAIAQRYANQDSRVRYYQNQWNIGFSGNMQKTTMLAHGDYILLHAADDVMLPGALERYVALIQKMASENRDLVLISDYYVVNQNGKRLSRVTLSHGEKGYYHQSVDIDEDNKEYASNDDLVILDGHEVLRQRFSKMVTFGWVGSVMFSRRLYEEVEGGYSNHWINPDKQFMYKILSKNPSVLWIRQPFFNYRVHNFNQNSQQAESGVLKYLLDQYALTFEFENGFYQEFGKSRQTIAGFFVEIDCINSALREMAIGNRKLGFRHLCFGLATYPDIALRNPKTYLAFIAWLLAPIVRPFLKLLYKAKKANG